MAMNLASKYSKKIDERFSLKSLTNIAVNNEYDWSGVQTVTVYGVDTVAMNDYARSGSTRYGTANELGNTKQDLTLSKDRSFTFTIDRGNFEESMMVMQSGKALARQIDEVVVPEIDEYRLSVMAAAAVSAGGSATAAVDADGAYAAFLAGTEYLNDNKVPIANRIAFVTPAFYSYIKLDDSFIKASDIAQKMLVNGQVGRIDNVRIIMVPSSYFPANTAFILCHPMATVGPKKLEDYKTHDNPPGINGWLVEGRIIYDAFVLDNKNKAVYIHMIE
jgi:N4-gp56 family major capsid protein